MSDKRRTIKPNQQRPGSRRTPLIIQVDPGSGALLQYDDPNVVGDVPVHEMTLPFRCSRCHKVYDGGLVTVRARYADCDMWNGPCCGAQHDTRTAWTGRGPGQRMGYVDIKAAERDRTETMRARGW